MDLCINTTSTPSAFRFSAPTAPRSRVPLYLFGVLAKRIFLATRLSGVSLNWCITDEVTTRNTTAYCLAHSAQVKSAQITYQPQTVADTLQAITMRLKAVERDVLKLERVPE